MAEIFYFPFWVVAEQSQEGWRRGGRANLYLKVKKPGGLGLGKCLALRGNPRKKKGYKIALGVIEGEDNY